MGDMEIKRYLEEMSNRFKVDLDEHEARMERRMKDMKKEIQSSSLQSHEATRKQVQSINLKVDELWRTVKGSDPPPPEKGSGIAPQATAPRPASNPGERRPTSIADQVTEHEGDIATIQGSVLRVDGRVESVDDKVDALASVVNELKDLQVKQMHSQGIKTEEESRSFWKRLGDGVIWAFKEPEGRKFALTMMAAITSLVTAAGTTYALITGRLPMPNADRPPPALHQPSHASSEHP